MFDGFVSSSFKGQSAFTNDLQVEIAVPEGTPALAWGGTIGMGSESEVLLQHGRSYQLLEMTELPNGRTYIKCVQV
jgi:hypothetical protein